MQAAGVDWIMKDVSEHSLQAAPCTKPVRSRWIGAGFWILPIILLGAGLWIALFVWLLG